MFFLNYVTVYHYQKPHFTIILCSRSRYTRSRCIQSSRVVLVISFAWMMLVEDENWLRHFVYEMETETRYIRAGIRYTRDYHYYLNSFHELGLTVVFSLRRTRMPCK